MSLIDLLFPKLCVGCDKFGNYLCYKCSQNILQSELVCPNCERLSIGGATHPLCKKSHGLDGLWSLGIYQGTLQKIIQKLKYHFVSDLGESLVSLTLEYWAKFNPQFLEEIKKDKGVGWTVVPVPLHINRQKFRGFNQSALLGKILALKISLEYREYLKRVKNTKPQVGLEGWQRKQNIKDAFALTGNYILYPNILLIDDVWTTGSTLKECCYTLKRGGSKKVWAITLAR